MNKQLAIGAALLLFGTGLVGCSNTAEGAKEDASNAGTAVKTGAEKTAVAVDNTAKAVGDTTAAAAKDVSNAAKDAGTAVKTGAEKAATGAENAAAGAAAAVANVGEAAAVTPKVKTALLNDSELGNHDDAVINVDTKDGKVVLRGHVKTNDMKKKAETITKKTLDDAKYTNPIVNQLMVGAH